MFSASNARLSRSLIVLMASLWLAACSPGDAPQTTVAAPVAFQSGDECHVCGMVIGEFPGPKGQVLETHSGAVRKFCSTRDLLTWWLQPEHKALQAQLYVHDMGQSTWATPEDGHLVDARTALYVIGSDAQGAMGPTLASFAQRAAADAFAASRGGQVYTFDQLDLPTLQQVGDAPHAHHAHPAPQGEAAAHHGH